MILLLYRFYSNRGLTECNLSVVPAIYWSMYMYYFPNTPWFYDNTLITVPSLCFQTLNCAYLNNKKVRATESLLPDNQMPYALNVCQIQRYNQPEIRVQNQEEKKNKTQKACSDNWSIMEDHQSFLCLKISWVFWQFFNLFFSTAWEANYTME